MWRAAWLPWLALLMRFTAQRRLTLLLLTPLPAASRALEQLNYTQLGQKAIRIMWSHRDPQFRKSGVGNIFIKARRPAPQQPTCSRVAGTLA